LRSILRWRAPFVGAGIPSAISPIVIGGCGSSGTTLLRRMLDRHPAIFCGPESRLFTPRTGALADLAHRFGFPAAQVQGWHDESPTREEFIERFQAACLAMSGKTVWAEKTPENIREFPTLVQRFPRARLVHVIRDGRDVACSLRDARWLSLEKMTAGADRGSAEALEACVRYWVERVTFGRQLRGHPSYHELRYEDLVADPETTLRGLLAFAGLDFDPAMLAADQGDDARDGRPIFHASAGRWRSDLTAEEGAIVERIAGPLLADLGYARNWAWIQDLAPTAARRPAPIQAHPDLKTRLKNLRREALARLLALGDPQFVAGLITARPVAAERLRLHRLAAAWRLSRHVWQVSAPRPHERLAHAGEALARIASRLCGAARAPGYVVDGDLRFVTVSPGALATWGKAADEVLGRHLLDVFPAASRISYSAHLEALRTSRGRRLRIVSRTLGAPMKIAIQPVSDGLRVQFQLAA